MWIENIINFIKENHLLRQITFILLILLLSYISYFVTKRVFLNWIGKIVKKSKTTLDDLIFNDVISRRLSFIPPILIIYNFSYMSPDISFFIQRISLILIALIVLTVISTFLRSLNTIYEQKKQFKGRPIKGFIQALIILLYIVVIITIIVIITGESLLVLLSGLGALTAVLMLIFRDTILSFIASIEITTNDLVRVGDWIGVKSFGADGDVIDIALHTIKIQNWDKTITVIPTHKLIDASFKNWRGMRESGGRRIKRTLSIDITSIKICSEEMVENYEKIKLLQPYIEKKKKEISEDNKINNIDMNSNLVNGRRLTNIGTFRAYIEAYLQNHSKINNDMTFLVRQLQPGPEGLPIEIYVFSTDIRWSYYEAIQSDIFDHILSVVNEFDLKIFQYSANTTPY